jgi:hypothetical protein
MAVIHVSGFRKTDGSTVAVDDVSFDVNAGEIGVDREPSERSRRPYNSSQLGPCSRAQEGA